MSRLSHIRIGRNALVILLVSLLIVSITAPTSFAASKATGTKKYVEITEKPVKVGNYYYKECHNSNYSKSWISRSKKNNSGYEKVLGNNVVCAFTNGKAFYYFRRGKNNSMVLSKCSSSGKNKKRLKIFRQGVEWQLYCNPTTVYKGNIYIAMDPVKGGRGTYIYNLSKHKITKVANDCIYKISGRYVIAAEHFSTDGYGFAKSSLYKITSKGKMKKIRNLRSNDGAGEFVGNYIYYIEYIDGTDGTYENYNLVEPIKIKVYRYKKDGSKEKLLNSFSFSDDFFLCIYSIKKITSKYCDIMTGNGDNYRLNYKTGKRTKL